MMDALQWASYRYVQYICCKQESVIYLDAGHLIWQYDTFVCLFVVVLHTIVCVCVCVCGLSLVVGRWVSLLVVVLNLKFVVFNYSSAQVRAQDFY